MKTFVKVKAVDDIKRSYYIDLDSISYFYFQDWKRYENEDIEGQIIVSADGRTFHLTKESSEEVIKLLGINVQRSCHE